MRQIQQLSYDGKRLYCPDHPYQPLLDSSSETGKFQKFCGATADGGKPCMNSAEWPSREAMKHDLETDKTVD